jgi:D-alanyl-D-alanine carboxypeptidase
MNQRARELGCTNTHFENASGLNGNHTTTARDMALITKAALNNATVRTVLQTKTYTLPATSSRGKLTCTNSNRLLSGGADYYEGIIGGKTGYTSKAGSCLASGIERSGHQLIAVVFKSNSTQYTDTKALYDYGLKRIGASGTAASASETGSTGDSSSSAAAGGKWEQTADGWKYLKADGKYCTNEWLDVKGNTYFFGSNSLMCIGWKQFTNGSWYYFNPENGAMVRGKWVTQNQKSYYLQSNGIMAVNTVIDGKYRVNENGVYVEKVG